LKTLYLMRHAKSDWLAGVQSDFDRPLNERGRREATEMGDFLCTRPSPPERVVSSSALRARQTTEQVFLQTGWSPEKLLFESSLYMASLRTLIEICEAESHYQSLLILGHNPGLDDLLVFLCGEDVERTHNGELFTTANIAVIELADGVIDQKQNSQLIELRRPQ
jgi:phosphohistidine phosphatase